MFSCAHVLVFVCTFLTFFRLGSQPGEGHTMRDACSQPGEGRSASFIYESLAYYIVYKKL